MKKLYTSMFIVLTLLALTSGTVFAQEITPITGTVQNVVIETSSTTSETIVIVTLLDETTGTSQTVNISLDTAIALGLVTTDPITGVSTVSEIAVSTILEIDPTTILPEVVVPTEETQHPVGSALSDFFSNLLGVDYETIMTYHDDGVGFGVIAQALWLTNNLNGGTTDFEALIEAKQSGDYSNITLADGSTPDNWGDVVKSLKKGNNLGSVMSDKDKASDNTTETTTQTTGNGSGNSNGNSGSNGNGNSNGNNAHVNGNGNGGGHP